ncbi:hypothetical protein GTW51_09975 [Aurantimonas aggregata]|uniref:Uncharacterized protein n=1 Tax=Aurantimonas aggregata TaxID=2047720 RepID=A0A6L9MGT9_9HYPH|nr:hypothetical protein [Aurantimonas aggregata]NDV87029.1 hypothetical protein [Aurantimonas aggregata]
MTDQERINRLEQYIRAEEKQRDWLLVVDWSGDWRDAKQAAEDSDRKIAALQSLIARLRAREAEIY